MKQDQASRTAKFVSNGIYWVSRQPELAVEVPPVLRLYTDAMTEQINPGQLLGSSELEQFILLKQSQVLQAASVPGIYLHQVLRKRCIESLTRAVVNTGIQQVVIIGAGYDTLSLRLSSEQPRLTVIELDHPATQRVKRDAISRFHLDIGASSFFPVDLSSQGLEAALCACPEFKANQPTLFIAEGLTMYLTASRVREMLQCIQSQNADSKFIFTYMEESAPGRFHFQHERFTTSLWLALQHEEFTWGVRSTELPTFLAESQFQLIENKTSRELRQEFLTESNRQATLATGENVALAASWDSGDCSLLETKHADR